MKLFYEHSLWHLLLLGAFVGNSLQVPHNLRPDDTLSLTENDKQILTRAIPGWHECTVFYLQRRPPSYNNRGRIDITQTILNQGRLANIRFPGVDEITVDLDATPIESDPGRHFVALNWVSHFVERYTVIVEQFGPGQNVDIDQPIASYEIGLPRATPGPFHENPGRLRRCFDSRAGSQWVLQVRGRTIEGE